MNADPGAEEYRLPEDLWHWVLSQFDYLHSLGELLYTPHTSNLGNAGGQFEVTFQIAPQLKKKPVLSAEATERKTNNVTSNPFANPDPSFVLAADVGSSHLLMLNKFCVYRPSLLLVTKTYAPQSDVLDAADLSASWQTLRGLSGNPDTVRLMAFYNCGVESGSSQGHKHMQLVPYPRRQEIGFELFPARTDATTSDVVADIPGVPHQHFVLRLPSNADTANVIHAHETLLQSYRNFLENSKLEAPHPPHNLILTDAWMCLIPRQASGYDRDAPTNALGMLGVIWTSGQDEIEQWTQASGSIENHLRYLGFPSNAPGT